MTPLSYVEVDRSALQSNLAALTKLCRPGVDRIAVVKGNAYGHGIGEVVQALAGQVDGFQVDDLEELRELRKFTDQRALVLGFVQTSDLDEALELGCELAIYDSARIKPIVENSRRRGQRVRVHLKLDNWLGRQGLLPPDAISLAKELSTTPEVDVVAMYGHFSNIEDTDDLSHARKQVDRFDECFRAIVSVLPGMGRHLSSTAGLMTMEPPHSSNDLVRLGIGIYGLYPSAALKSSSGVELRPALRWVTHLAQVKILPEGHPVGYGLTFATPESMPIGIVPQGYSDGFDRGLSNRGSVLVSGVRCPVIGRVAMNMFAVDLSPVPNANAGDEVVLIGDQQGCRISAEEMANHLGTINYEVVTRISPLLPRRLV